ncbi:MAG TPA: protein translocase subunit SecF [Caulobacterales bacterium]|nr:protein translocase subunit SecF [Caulobacterales bacterium]
MPWPLIKLIPRHSNFKFVRFAFFASFGSILAVVLSFGSMFTGGYRENPIAVYEAAEGSPLDRIGVILSHGFNLGIDFKGGTALIIEAPEAIDVNQLHPALEALNIGEVKIQTFGDDKKRAQVSFNPVGPQTATAVHATIARVVPNVDFKSQEVVGAEVSSELFTSGLIALGLAMLLVMIYIWFRFDLQFGFGAVLSLFHDTILTLGVFSFFRIDFTLPVIAGLLTVIGYSMNDTVVVFDRMRENFRRFKSMKPTDVIDLSINETLSRTLMTVATVLIASGALYLWGGTTLEPFAICMLFGCVVATYSSIYIAAPALPLFGDRPGRPQPKHGLMARSAESS